MLIRFKVSNFLSFKEETEFSMVAGKERIHPNHVIKGEKNQPNLLRAALLYGANAAGKSNFVKAIEHAGLLILEMGKSILLTEVFKLDEESHNKPSKFVFEIIVNEKVYEYGFEVSFGAIEEEWLIEFSQGTEICLFKRTYKKGAEVTFAETDFLKKKADKEFLKFIQKSTIPSKLFLTHCKNNNVEWFRDVYEWFANTLEIVYPNSFNSRLEKMLQENISFREFFKELNKKAGTGITSFEIIEFYGRTDEWGRPTGLIIEADSITKPQEKNAKKAGAEKLSRLKLFHNNEEISQGNIFIETHFEKEQESEGTQRLFDLAFPFYDLATSKTPKVYIIDELERNLHTNLSYMLLKSYLEQTGKGQLIATTHDTHLLDLDLLRRDEIWFAEKDEHGATQLYSLYEFNPRYDKKIEKEYLTGRFGAIPFLGNLEFKKQLAKNGKSKK